MTIVEEAVVEENSKGDEKNQQLYKNLQKVDLNVKRSATNRSQRSIHRVGGKSGFTRVSYKGKEVEVVKVMKAEAYLEKG